MGCMWSSRQWQLFAAHFYEPTGSHDSLGAVLVRDHADPALAAVCEANAIDALGEGVPHMLSWVVVDGVRIVGAAEERSPV